MHANYPLNHHTIVWYQLYAFIVGRGYNEWDETNGYWFNSYCVFPSSAKNGLIGPRESKYNINSKS